MNKVKILVIGLTNNYGGVETYYMSYYRQLLNRNITIDFVKTCDKLAFEDEMVSCGSNVYRIENPKKNPFAYQKKLKQIIIEGQYDVVHVNMLSAANIVPLKIAKKCNVKTIIAHSHNAGMPIGLIRKILHNINKSQIKKYATNFFACSEKAGYWLFNDSNFVVINNALDLKKFKYNDSTSKKLRTNNSLKDEFVIGHVGRFCEQKNHAFLIEVIEKLVSINDNIKVVFIGTGELEDSLKAQIKEKNIEKYFLFLGKKYDVYNYYNMFDIFVLPSLFEGLPVVGIEAQANGLPCIFSSNITRELKCNNNVEFVGIAENNVNDWVNLINEMISNNRTRELSQNNLKDKYDIEHEADYLYSIYVNEVK